MSCAAYDLSPIDWLMPRGYFDQVFIFPVDNAIVFTILRRGLNRLVEYLPYLLSGVVDQNSPSGSVRLSTPFQTVDDLISLGDCSAMLSYSTLAAAGFPPSALNSPTLRPSGTIQAPRGDPEAVFRAKVTLIEGGFLLCMIFHHSVTDIIGVQALLKLWAKCCQTDPVSITQVDISWTDRSLLHKSAAAVAAAEKFSKLKTISQLPETAPALIPLQDQPQLIISPPPAIHYETRIFNFSLRDMVSLKARINEYLSTKPYAAVDSSGHENDEEHVVWISTGDVLAGILWSATVWAESDGDRSDHVYATARIPVNIRSKHQPPLPPDYLGAAVLMTTATTLRATLLSLSHENNRRFSADCDEAALEALARVCAAVRKAIKRVTNSQIGQALAYTICQSDVGRLRLSPHHRGISIVSWACEDVDNLDWGKEIGHCVAVRILNVKAKRYPIILPCSQDGERLEVVASFDQPIMSKFQESKLIKRYCTWNQTR
ncbi:transferase family-domain-containing protein [Coniella lustricola]|uniref:Transferase family-domain-containing protein n=1 Tax=Coniella lustricola TaxID=2025994 RepID=A0A2T3A0D1_9PEZI|nr:transferase family-domain-containing protein [Coniella lustricola]